MFDKNSAYLAAVVVAVFWAHGTSATSAAPPAHSPEACVCHIDGKGGPEERDGSNATNATICVQSMDTGKRWCNVTIECLRNHKLPNCETRGAPVSSLPKLFESHLRSLRAIPTLRDEANRLENGFSQINGLSRDPPPALRGCSANFEKGEPTSPVIEGRLSCGVSRNSRWLFIDYIFDAVSVRFLFSRQ
ncbi:MAG: hypothetical protein K2Z80_07820 [Xanthobacteraceae bacterium]|nr:hypothetical protein [Xanthobacteraceae bacterium]